MTNKRKNSGDLGPHLLHPGSSVVTGRISLLAPGENAGMGKCSGIKCRVNDVKPSLVLTLLERVVRVALVFDLVCVTGLTKDVPNATSFFTGVCGLSLEYKIYFW